VASRRELCNRWREDLAGWAIPEGITSGVSESPWVLPRQVFARRSDRQSRAPAGPSYERAWEALDPPGTVLDVGAGAGAACLPLAPRTTALTAVDADAIMLGLLTERAEEIGLDFRTVAGRWPDVAPQVPPADVVTCCHVLYNVGDIEPFLMALTCHARRRVVVEVTAAHPLASLNPLWWRFHGLRRPTGPTVTDLLRIVDAAGLSARHTEWSHPARADYESFAELVDVTRRRLCLPPERASEVEAALLEMGVRADEPTDLGSSGRDVVTIWWEGTA
jgi:SAM-dependent methyltransferase